MCPINFRWEETYTPTMHSASLTLAHNALHSPSTLCAAPRRLLSVNGSPGGGGRRGAASPLTFHVTMGGCVAVASSYKEQLRSKRDIGRGDRGWAATELRLNNRARSRHQANSSADSGWAAKPLDACLPVSATLLLVYEHNKSCV